MKKTRRQTVFSIFLCVSILHSIVLFNESQFTRLRMRRKRKCVCVLNWERYRGKWFFRFLYVWIYHIIVLYEEVYVTNYLFLNISYYCVVWGGICHELSMSEYIILLCCISSHMSRTIYVWIYHIVVLYEESHVTNYLCLNISYYCVVWGVICHELSMSEYIILLCCMRSHMSRTIYVSIYHIIVLYEESYVTYPRMRCFALMYHSWSPHHMCDLGWRKYYLRGRNCVRVGESRDRLT